MRGRVSLDDFNAIPAAAVPLEWDGELAQLLEQTRAFWRRFVVVVGRATARGCTRAVVSPRARPRSPAAS
jgi:hypothetical protein